MIGRREEFGAELKRLRQERDISLEEVSRITKIRRAILESLEAGRFEELPDEVFTVGFLKAYCRHLGLDEGLWVSRYRTLVGEVARESPTYLAEKPERRFHAWPFLLILLLLGGGWGTYWIFQRKAAPGKDLAGPVTSADPLLAKAPAAAPTQEGAQTIRPDSEESTLPEPSAPGPLQLPASSGPAPPGEYPEVPAASEVGGDLQLQFSEPCWVEIWKGSVRVVYRLCESGESLSLKGDSFAVTLGNRKAASARWKGAPISPPESESPVVTGWQFPPQEVAAPIEEQPDSGGTP